MRFTLRQLEVFLAVARIESVSRAGKELGMSQSAVSSSLSDLEGQLGVPLFDRAGKKLRLSDTGRSMRARAEGLWQAARDLDAAFGAHDAATVRLGATLTIGNYLVPPLVAQFLRASAGSRVTLDIANTEEIARRVENFEIDVGLIEGELSREELRVTAWREDELVVFSAPDHPLAKKRALTDSDLIRAAWVLRERGSGTRQAFDRALAGLLPNLNVVLELTQTEAIRGAVAAGLGLGCVSRIALADSFRSRALVPLRVPGRSFRRQLYVVLHRRKFIGTALRKFLTICGEHDGEAG
ncbi:MAG TPA: LysR family transcriptional regulator [Polyangiaceae bacterium]|nr:LysR family transcriptional regulator [Polyangiaceae bacterium]